MADAVPKSCNAINTFNKCLLKRFAAQKFPISSGCGKGLRKSYVMAFFLSLLRCTKSLKILCHDNNIPTRQGLSLVSSSNACRSISGIKWKKKNPHLKMVARRFLHCHLHILGLLMAAHMGWSSKNTRWKVLPMFQTAAD